MSSTLIPRFRLRDPKLLRTLMQHTGDGSKTTVRELADRAEVHHSFVYKLLTGEQKTAEVPVASAVARRIGVDLLILWAPDERTATSTAEQTPAEEVAA